MKNTKIECAFVSTNSICQGEQVPILWPYLFDNYGVVISFAYRPFVWGSESSSTAHVHCVIVGFALFSRTRKLLYEDNRKKSVSNINGYLVNAENIFIKLRGKCPKNVPKLTQGSKPWDGGNLLLSKNERDELVRKYPQADKFIKRFVGSKEFINNIMRYCLWLKNVSPEQYNKIPEVIQRLKNVAEIRSKTKTVAVRAQAETPMLFSQDRQPTSEYLIVPETSSENRKYIPIGFMSSNVVAGNSTLTAMNADMYLFGVMTSNVHMAWMRTVCGRLEMRYRYSPSVYNNFPWPKPTERQKEKIEKTAREILNIRKKHPNLSLADLYNPITMPNDLLNAHRANDEAVMRAYGFWGRLNSEADCVAELMKMYQKLTNEK